MLAPGLVHERDDEWCGDDQQEQRSAVPFLQTLGPRSAIWQRYWAKGLLDRTLRFPQPLIRMKDAHDLAEITRTPPAPGH